MDNLLTVLSYMYIDREICILSYTHTRIFRVIVTLLQPIIKTDL